MRKTLLIATGLALSATLSVIAQEVPLTPTTAPTTIPAEPSSLEVLERVSYGLGHNMGRELNGSMTEFGVALDGPAIEQGLRDGLSGSGQKFTEQELAQAFQIFQSNMMEKEATRQKALAEKAGAEGKAYLESNKVVAGVKVTESGLQCQIIEQGTGAQPKATDVVKVHYTGTLVDGTKFGSSRDDGEPAQFEVNGVIKGWTEGIQLLKVGGKARLVISPELAYGLAGRPPVIPPNSTLIFEIELLEIVPALAEPVAPTEPTPATTPASPAAPTDAPTAPQQP